MAIQIAAESPDVLYTRRNRIQTRRYNCSKSRQCKRANALFQLQNLALSRSYVIINSKPKAQYICKFINISLVLWCYCFSPESMCRALYTKGKFKCDCAPTYSGDHCQKASK